MVADVDWEASSQVDIQAGHPSYSTTSRDPALFTFVDPFVSMTFLCGDIFLILVMLFGVIKC